MFKLRLTPFIVYIVILAGESHASPWESFESSSVPSEWNAPADNSITVSDAQKIHSDQSLKWEWTTETPVIEYAGDIGDPTGYVSSFSFWVYLDTPMEGSHLRVEFLKDNQVISGFDFGLSFHGWRTAFVPYRDMDGQINKDVNRMRLTLEGASVPDEGSLHLDQVIFSKVMDSRHQYEDVQVPFVREGMHKGHWEPRVEERGRNPRDHYSVNQEEINSAAALAQSWEEALIGSGEIYAPMVDIVEEQVQAFGLERTENGVQGNHIFYNSYPGIAYPDDLRQQVQNDGKKHDFREFGNLMLKIADYYLRASDPELKTRLKDWFILGAELLLKQGWADGSNQGSIHHFGYQAREYFEAHFLMREVLAEAGILNESRAAIQWYTRAGQLLNDYIEPNMDYYNTISKGQLLGLLMEEDPERRAAWVKAFSEGLSQTLSTVTPGDGLGFKPDGTAFHHNGHYPAYAIGAFSTLGPIFDKLRETPFEVSTEGHETFRNALLASRIYSQKFDWPIGISGRHPFSGSIQNMRGTFEALAQYPHPETGESPDPEVTGAYLRLWGTPGGELGTLVEANQIQPETLQGIWSFPFANQAVARGPGWMASMKGYSKYVWSSEIYTRDNRFGRYQSNGTIEILHEDGRIASGFEQDGWDWNRLPGTTGVHLPLDQLESPRSGTLMRRSNETFAGTAVLDGQFGIFGLILNEEYFGNDLKARKSVIMLPDYLIALGSGIESKNTNYPTETTLFQTALYDPDTPQQFSFIANPVTGLNQSGHREVATGIWLKDPVGNAYWLSRGSNLRWHRASQNSKHNKTKEETQGDFSAAWLDHGTAPSGDQYHYAVFPKSSNNQIQQFHDSMQSSTSAPYNVLAQTSMLHAVMQPEEKRLFISAFEPQENLSVPWIKEIKVPMLLVLEEDGSNLLVAATNPDLNPTEDGHAITHSEIVISGLWIPVQADRVLYWQENQNTHLIFPSKAGASIQVKLQSGESSHSRTLQNTEDGDQVPWEIFNASTGGFSNADFLLNQKSSHMKIYWLQGTDPNDYGLDLEVEGSSDLSFWSPVSIEHQIENNDSVYKIPVMSDSNRFYRFNLHIK